MKKKKFNLARDRNLVMFLVVATVLLVFATKIATPTGLAVSNSPPVWTGEDSFTIDTSLTLNLDLYAEDPEGKSLSYLYADSGFVDLNLKGSILTITPTREFSQEQITVIVSDGKNLLRQKLFLSQGFEQTITFLTSQDATFTLKNKYRTEMGKIRIEHLDDGTANLEYSGTSLGDVGAKPEGILEGVIPTGPEVTVLVDRVYDRIIRTEVFVVEGATLQYGKITVPQYGKVNVILICPVFDSNFFTCKSDWELTPLVFLEGERTITFTIDKEGVYAGGFVKQAPQNVLLESEEGFVKKLPGKTPKSDKPHKGKRSTLIDKALEQRNEAPVLIFINSDAYGEQEVSTTAAARQTRKNWVRDKQTQVLNKLNIKQRAGSGTTSVDADTDFVLDFQLENLPILTGSVTAQGYEKLLEDPDVEVFYDVVDYNPPPESDLDLEVGNPAVGANVTRVELNFTGRNVTVAIIDSGVDYSHFDLGNCTTAEFTSRTCRKVIDGFDFVNKDNDPMDDTGHGTHVAGIIGGEGNLTGLFGVAPDVKFLIYKACDSSGSCSTSNELQSIDRAVGDGADIIHMSLGGFSFPATGTRVTSMGVTQAVRAFGVVAVISSGNDGPGVGMASAPASARGALMVGAMNDQGTVTLSDDTLASFSSTGPTAFGEFDPDITAPGNSINSTAPLDDRCDGSAQDLCSNSLYNPQSGTSFSAPFVTGAAALIMEAHAGVGVDEVRFRIMGAAENISGHPFQVGTGMLNVTRAVTQEFWSLIESDVKATVEVWPGEHRDVTLTLLNLGPFSKLVNYEFEDIINDEEDKTLPRSIMSFETDVVAFGFQNTTNKFRITLPSTASPGMYATIITIRTNASDQVRVPLAIVVPQVGAGTFNGTTDNSDSAFDEGDHLQYKIIPLNATQLTVTISWENAGTNDIDADLWAPARRTALQSSTGSSPITLTTNVSQTEYWLRIQNDVGTGEYAFNVTVTTTSNMSVTPTAVFDTISKGNNRTFNFTITNGASAINNLALRAYELVPVYEEIIGTNYPNGFSFISFTQGFPPQLNLTNQTRNCNVRLNWSDPTIDIDLLIYTHNNGAFSTQSSPQSSSFNPQLNQSEENFFNIDLAYWFSSQFNDSGFAIVNNNATSEVADLTVNCTAYGNSSKISISNSSIASVPASNSFTVSVNVSSENLSLGEVNRFYFMGFTNNYDVLFQVPIEILTATGSSSGGFDGATTNFNQVPDLLAVENAILQIQGSAKIVWNGTVNAENLNFTPFVTLGDEFVSIDTSGLHPSFNSSADVTIENVRCENIRVFASDQLLTSASDIILNGAECNATTSPACTSIACSEGNLTFTTSHFSSFAATTESCGLVDKNLTLISDVTANGTCFTITSNDLVLDCNGFGVGYGLLGGNAVYGVNVTGRRNVTVKNCDITDLNAGGNSAFGIFFSATGHSLLLNNTIHTNGSIASTGMRLQSTSQNNTIAGNTIVTQGTGNFNRGVDLTGASSDNIIKDNMITTNGTQQNYGIEFTSFSNRNNVTNNTIITQGSGGQNRGITLLQALRTLIRENNITSGAAGATTANHGIRMDIGSTNNVIQNNIINAQGTSGDSSGINIVGTSPHNIIKDNTIITNGSAGTGIAIASGVNHNTTIMNNSILPRGGGDGITLNSTNDTIVTDNLIDTNGTIAGLGIELSNSASRNLISFNRIITSGSGTGYAISTIDNAINNTFIGNNLTSNGTTDSYAINIQESNSSQFNDTILDAPGQWLLSDSTSTNNMTNTTFKTESGNLHIFNTVDINGSQQVRHQHLNISQNNIFLNSTNLTFLNTSARLTLNNLGFISPIMKFDEDDDGTFTECTAPQCINESFDGSTFIFNVTRFTSYAAAETPSTCRNLTASLDLANDVASAGTCFNITASNVILDCKGFMINYSQVIGGHGINATGVNNITIRNCNIIQGTATTLSDGINLRDSNFSVVRDSLVNVSGTASSGVVMTGSHTILQNSTVFGGSNSFATFSGATSTNISWIDNRIEVIGVGIGIGISLVGTNSKVIGNTIIGTAADALLVSGSGNNITNNSILQGSIGGAGSPTAITLTGANNTLVDNVAIAESTDGVGILVSSSFNTLIRNVAFTNNTEGVTESGISVTGGNNTFIDNNATTVGSAAAWNVAEDNNTFIGNGMFGTAGNGARLTSDFNTLVNNSLRSASGKVMLLLGGSFNLLINNTLFSTTTSATATSLQVNTGNNNTYLDNHFNSLGSFGVTFSASSDNTLIGNILNGTGNTIASGIHDIIIDNVIQGQTQLSNGVGGKNNTILNNTFISSTNVSTGVALTLSGANNTFEDNVFEIVAARWIIMFGSGINNTFQNTTFRSENGSISILPKIDFPNATNISLKTLNISANLAFINTSTALSFLNTSAIITFNNLPFSGAVPRVDFEDDGTFEDCDATQCQVQSFSNGIFIFNVTSFTSYTAVAAGTAPNVTNITPTNGTSFDVGLSIEIAATVIDNESDLTTVVANVLLENGTIIVVNLNNATISDRFNGTYNTSANLGLNNVTFVATDATSNVNNTERVFFFVNDTLAPNVTGSTIFANQVFSLGTSVDLGTNVTDNGQVSLVFGNVTQPNGTVINVTLVLQSGNFFNASFSIPQDNGTYLLRYVANDTANNINDTETLQFFGNDTTRPDLVVLTPSTNEVVSLNTGVILNATVTDNVAVVLVLVNITLPNGTVQEFNLTQDGTQFSISFLPSIQGNHSALFIASDANGNVNDTDSRVFFANDTTAPNITSVNGCAPNPAEPAELVFCNATIVDNLLLSNVSANLTLLDGTSILPFVIQIGDTFQFNTSQILLGQYNVTWFANDTNNNSAFSQDNFTVADNSGPNITAVCAPIAGAIGANVTCNATIVDFSVITNVSANVTFPNGTILIPNITNLTGGLFQFNVTNNNVSGVYNVTWFANDSVANNNTAFTQYSIDVVAIAVGGCSINRSNANFTTTCNATITSFAGITNFTANVTAPDGTIFTQTVTNISSLFEFTFNTTTSAVLGRHNITWFANDTAGNTDTQTDFFIVNTPPNLSQIPNQTIQKNSLVTRINITPFFSDNDGDSLDSLAITEDFPTTIDCDVEGENVTMNTSVPDFVGLTNCTAVASDGLANSSAVQFFITVTASNNSINISSNISNSILFNSTIINSSIGGSTLNNTNVNTSSLNFTNSFSCDVIDSIVISSDIGDCIIDPSTVINSTVLNATVTNSTKINSTIINSTVINSINYNATILFTKEEFSGINDSGLNTVNITNSNVINSTINDSSIDDSNITQNAVIETSSLSFVAQEGGNTSSSTIETSLLKQSNVTDVTSMTDCTLNTSVYDSSTCASSDIDQSFVQSSSVTNSVIFNCTVINSVLNGETCASTTLQNFVTAAPSAVGISSGGGGQAARLVYGYRRALQSTGTGPQIITGGQAAPEVGVIEEDDVDITAGVPTEAPEEPPEYLPPIEPIDRQPAVCGDDVCRFPSETEDSCPQDCALTEVEGVSAVALGGLLLALLALLGVVFYGLFSSIVKHMASKPKYIRRKASPPPKPVPPPKPLPPKKAPPKPKRSGPSIFTRARRGLPIFTYHQDLFERKLNDLDNSIDELKDKINKL